MYLPLTTLVRLLYLHLARSPRPWLLLLQRQALVKTWLGSLLDSAGSLTTGTKQLKRSTHWFIEEPYAFKGADRRLESKRQNGSKVFSEMQRCYICCENNIILFSILCLNEKQLSPITAHVFLDFFYNMIDEIRNTISSSTLATPADPVSPNLHQDHRQSDIMFFS